MDASAVYPFADLALARRLERTEASSNAACVEARAVLEPAAGAAWIEVAGAYAMFDGPDSFLTQTFGLGVFDPVDMAVLETLETFFSERGAPVYHEVSPLASAVIPLLVARGYQPVEFTNVLYRPVDGTTAGASADFCVRRIAPDEAARWADTAAQGWSEDPDAAAFMRTYGELLVRASGMNCFVAEREGTAVAAGGLGIYGRVAILAGASTVPAARGRGAQRALLEARLRCAADQGCDLAMMGTAPGSASQRNAERQGFRIAYTRVKWGRPSRYVDPET